MLISGSYEALLDGPSSKAPGQHQKQLPSQLPCISSSISTYLGTGPKDILSSPLLALSRASYLSPESWDASASPASWAADSASPLYIILTLIQGSSPKAPAGLEHILFLGSPGRKKGQRSPLQFHK